VKGGVGAGPNVDRRLAYFAAAMSRNQRIALVVAAVAVAVLAFVIAQPGDDDDGSEQAATTPAQTETGGGSNDGGAQAPAETAQEPPPPPGPEVTRIAIRDGRVVGGPQDIEVERGATVRIEVASNAPDELHLHGYDITRQAAPGQPARFQFRADAEGAFELESHTAEDAGLDPLVARIVVAPS
jgi:FtsP/CotA-like multicopper oxidase with cupredoxin domain